MANPSGRKPAHTSAKASASGAPNKTAAATAQQPSNDTESGSLVDELKQQHRQVEALLTQPADTEDLTTTIEQIAKAWIPHTLIEEQIVLPAIQQAGADEPAFAEATVRRDIVKLLLADLQESPSGAEAAAKLAVLGGEIEHLIEVEERPESGILAIATARSVDLDALRQQVDALKSQIESNPEGQDVTALEPSSLRTQSSRRQRQEEEYSSMPNNSNVRDRDERGRFESDDDRGGGYRSRGNDRDRDENGRFMSDDDRGYSSRSSRYDDDDRRSGSNGGGGRDRDDNGRFTSGGGSSRSSSRYDDDDDRRGGGRGDGRGWYGDSEGHSEASRRGWESREGPGYSSRSSRYDDDDRGGRSNGGRDGGRGDGRGWFGDSRGHSEAAREGWEDRRGGNGGRDRGYSSRSSRYDDDDRRGGGGGRGDGRGWFGDPQGHAEAAREGWEDRRGGNGGGSSSRSSRYDDDDRRGNGGGSSSRSSRDDDDDRRGGGGRGGHGGWFGDPEGHSEASRRGWEDRR